MYLLPHRVNTSIFDAPISFTGKADFCRTRQSEFKKIQRSMWVKSEHPSGRTIRSKLRIVLSKFKVFNWERNK